MNVVRIRYIDQLCADGKCNCRPPLGTENNNLAGCLEQFPEEHEGMYMLCSVGDRQGGMAGWSSSRAHM